MNLAIRIRYTIARAINRRPSACWAECVAWAEGMNDDGLLALFGSAPRNECDDPNAPCYCGKFCPANMPEYTGDDAPF